MLNLRLNKAYIVIIAVAISTIYGLPLVNVAPNRILPGEAVLMLEAVPTFWIIVFTILWLFYIPLIFRVESQAYRISAVMAGILIALFLMLAPSIYAQQVTENLPSARVSLGSGFWILFFCLLLVLADIIKQYYLGALTILIIIGSFTIVIWQGFWNDLSIMKEYAVWKEVFFQEAYQHIRLVISSSLIAIIIAIPLAVVAQRSSFFKAIIFNILNFTQTIPSMALFILLVAPLAWLAQQFPAFSEATNFGGIGWAPALITLSLYGILPIFQNAYTAIDEVDETLKEAALGMGMTKSQQFLKLILPLSLPLLLTGIRSTMVLLVGLTAVAGLIGAGGFGRFIFTGLGEQAMDLILLGVIPTVFLALIIDMVMGGIIKLCTYR